ncbi:MAG: hypothetical protein LBE37_18195 [Sphingobacterium sp.]|jgi:hypothetical protein|uniref:Lipoprotein n=2 Tax=Sphingobacterium TaxID=28453 RepID=A0A4R6WKS9_9SPHI|nr:MULTISPECIES: hypothetical protein [Sphingobacterium]MDR2285150.1 hypothetical protein [Sphingobacterium sp.]TDQ81292.1 hypothetical protein CLV99_0414 [Sphingobacterium yanglingense]
MKNLFAFGFLALALTVASCGNNTSKTEETADSLKGIVDSTAGALTDSINKVADSANKTIDSTAQVIDSTKNAQ